MKTTFRPLALAALALALACGGSSDPSPQQVQVLVTPGTATVEPNGAAAFSAQVSGSADTSVTWSVTEAAGGQVDGTGRYTAPATQGVYHVVATAVADPTARGSATVTVSTTPVASRPRLHIVNGVLTDPHGNRVMLRGVASQGMGQVYGDRDNPGTYLPMSVAQYVQRAVQTDATGNRWYANAIRLNFEHYPFASSPGRPPAGSSPTTPYAIPEQVSFPAWASGTYAVGTMVTVAGYNLQASPIFWQGDRGQAWNPGMYRVGDVVVGFAAADQTHVYRCTSAQTAAGGSWGTGPSGTAASYTDPVQGATWQYLGEWGHTGATAPNPTVTVNEGANLGSFVLDGDFMSWKVVGQAANPSTRQAAWDDWVAKVLDPAVQAGVDAGLYVVICEFDFGPAHHPFRNARMTDFWDKLSRSKWASHPQVLFELWNESETIGTYQGGPGSWAAQKPAVQAVVDLIRGNGATNIILVPPPFYSAWVGEATASPVSGTDLGYSLHMYRSQWESYSSNRDQISQALASGQAIFATEWGDDRDVTDPAQSWPYVSSVSPALRALFEPSEGAAHGVAGWFAWALTQSWYPDLYTDRALTSPTPWGVGVRQWLSDKRNDLQPVP